MKITFRKFTILVFGLGTILAIASFLAAAKSQDPPAHTAKIKIVNDIFNGDVTWAYQEAIDQPLGTIIAIHGTPGSQTAWSKLMRQPGIEDFNFIAFDRPGWGASQDISKKMYPELDAQAKIIAAALMTMNVKRPLILVSHSWGGPVVLKLAIDYPSLVDAAVLIASPAKASVSRPRWYHKVAKTKLVQLAIGSQMSRSNIEMLTLDQELEKIEDDFSDLQIPVAIMQGKKDWLVKPDNAFYLEEKLVKSEVRLYYFEKSNHFIPFKQTSDVLKAIRWTLSNVQYVPNNLVLTNDK